MHAYALLYRYIVREKSAVVISFLVIAYQQRVSNETFNVRDLGGSFILLSQSKCRINLNA